MSGEGDIAARLRATTALDCLTNFVGVVSLLDQAASEIERLRNIVNGLGKQITS